MRCDQRVCVSVRTHISKTVFYEHFTKYLRRPAGEQIILCLSVCLSVFVREHIFRTSCPIFTKFLYTLNVALLDFTLTTIELMLCSFFIYYMLPYS